MKRAWTRFSLRGSAAIGLALFAAGALAQQIGEPYRSNELTLAGLRPGRDPFTLAVKHYKSKYVTNDSVAATDRQWLDACTGRMLALKLDAHGDIQAVTVSALVPQDGKCDDRRMDALDEKSWTTGHGLHLGDPQNRVIELYGEPNASGPSAKADKELEFLRYGFAWAGSDVPQVMEIDCDRATGRVLEMMLAFSNP